MRRVNISILADRGLGVLVFLAGVAALVFVFAMSYRMFKSPVTIGESAASAAGATASIVVLLTRIVLLFVMVLVGSLVAGKGVQMYGATHRHTDEEKPDQPR